MVFFKRIEPPWIFCIDLFLFFSVGLRKVSITKNQSFSVIWICYAESVIPFTLTFIDSLRRWFWDLQMQPFECGAQNHIISFVVINNSSLFIRLILTHAFKCDSMKFAVVLNGRLICFSPTMMFQIAIITIMICEKREKSNFSWKNMTIAIRFTETKQTFYCILKFKWPEWHSHSNRLKWCPT